MTYSPSYEETMVSLFTRIADALEAGNVTTQEWIEQQTKWRAEDLERITRWRSEELERQMDWRKADLRIAAKRHEADQERADELEKNRGAQSERGIGLQEEWIKFNKEIAAASQKRQAEVEQKFLETTSEAYLEIANKAREGITKQHLLELFRDREIASALVSLVDHGLAKSIRYEKGSTRGPGRV